MNIFIYFFLFTCIGISTVNSSMDQNMNNGLTNVDKILYSFINREGKLIGEKYGMSQCSVGGGSIGGINLMSLDFQRYGTSLTEAEARRLIIKCLNDYLNAVNSDDELKPFLKNYPFKPNNIRMGIFNSNFDRKDIYHPYVSVVNASEGKIGYFTEEKSDPFHFKSKKYETYDEAIAILKKEQEEANSK